MEDRFQALMQGSQQPSRPENADPENDPLAQLPQGFWGGHAPQADVAQAEPAHTGLNRATAEASLQEVLNALGGHLGAGK